MKKAIPYICFLLSCCCLQQTAAQEYLSEAKSGYTGGFNTNVQKLDKSVNFLVVGDWGRNGQYYQAQVADQMGKTAATIDADFTVAVGDNFYPTGVRSVQDPQWKYSYEEVYRSHFLQNNWYVALGNHDYKSNIQAQIDYSTISNRWKMPASYYAQKIKLKQGGYMLLIVLDTNPFIDSYYGKEDELSYNIQKQDTAAQRKWLIETLSQTDSNIKWKIVVGHHPLYSGGKRKTSSDTRTMQDKFENLFDQYKVDAYLCGHEHDLQVIKSKGHFTTQFLSGAGCEVRPSGNREGTLFFASQPGIMTFSVTTHQMKVQVVHANGDLLYSTDISK